LNLLIFEYVTAIGIRDPALTAEGRAMIKGLVADLEGLNASFLISKHSDTLDGGSCNPIKIEEDLNEWIQDNIHLYDFCLPIAPEEDFILYELTRLIEKNGVQVVGASSDAVCTCSNKYLTYQALKNKVPVIPTRKVLWGDIEDYANRMSADKQVVKPADGVSCSAVYVIDSPEAFKKAAMRVRDVSSLPYFLLQDWVEGGSVSVSLLTNGKEAIPLSLNQQNISQTNGSIDYNGGKVPLNHPKENEAKEMAKKAVESIKGLKGYVGVDMILGEEVYLVEINSRMTTPYVALRNMLNFNLGEAIVDSVKGQLPEEVDLEGEVEFQKEGNHLQLKVIR
jgi:hypothetical protein